MSKPPPVDVAPEPGARPCLDDREPVAAAAALAAVAANLDRQIAEAEALLERAGAVLKKVRTDFDNTPR